MTNDDYSRGHRPSGIRTHRDLVVWRKSIDLAEETYRLARLLPSDERFILRQQMVRAVVSIPSNIAEGHGRMSRGDYVRFLSFARGSLCELDSDFELGRRLNYFGNDRLSIANALVDEVGRMLWSLVTKNGFRPWR